MPLLLDTFNVLHTVGVLPPDLAGIDIAGLAALIGRSRYRGERVTFACDGLPHAGLPAQGRLQIPEEPNADLDVTVRYSGSAAPADDLIRDLVNASTAPRRLIVVSSDHMVQRYARRRRCIVLSSQEFLQHLADDSHLPRQPRTPGKPTQAGMPEEQIEKWMRAFGVDEKTAEVVAASDDDLASNDVASPRDDAAPDPAPAVPRPETSANDPPSELRVPLPAELIAEAEQLWQRAHPAKPSQPPSRPAQPSSQATTLPDQSSSDTGPAVHSPETHHAEEAAAADDSHSIDMNDILPRDGRTQPLQRRNNRHRPQ